MSSADPRGRSRPDVDSTLREIERLHRSRRFRALRQRFFAEGVRNFVQLVDVDAPIATIVYSDKLCTAALARKLVRQRRRAGVPVVRLTPEQFRRVSVAERASGVGAIVRQPWSSLDVLRPDTGSCWLALETVRSPGNLGTLIRSSEALGGAGFLLLGESVDPFEPTVVRAAMGALFRQRFVRTDRVGLDRWLRRHDVPTLGASPDGDVDLRELRCRRPPVVILGEERRGLTSEQRRLCRQLVRIPMTGATDSLNLAVAGSLLLYEVQRSLAVSRVVS
ncbi:MAG: RNA methyltransferase [Acidobacteriota bacterium]